MADQTQGQVQDGGAAPPSAGEPVLHRIMMDTIGAVHIGGATLADVMLWEALAEDVQRAARLVLTGGIGADTVTTLEVAFKAGYRAGQQNVEVERESYHRREFEAWQRDQAQTGGR